MTHLDMQNLNRMTMGYIAENIHAGMPLSEVRQMCESYMLEHGADSFWYWDVGAFVFSGEDIIVSVSGKQYQTADKAIQMNEAIVEKGFVNLDFLGNLGHSIVQSKSERIYTERGNRTKLSEVEMFTFEPHISVPGSRYGYKREDFYYFSEGRLVKL